MKTWKIVLVAALATLAIGLVTASAFAYAGRSAATQYGTYNGAASPSGGYFGGMVGGGMMGGNSAYGANAYSAGYQRGTLQVAAVTVMVGAPCGVSVGCRNAYKQDMIL